MRNLFLKIVLISTISITLSACSSDIVVPKPSLYLRTEYPSQEYKPIEVDCPYSFEINKDYSIINVPNQLANTCHREIDLGKLNGTFHLSYIKMEEPLSSYVNYINDKVEEHFVKASGKNVRNYVNPEKKVYGTIFEIQGNVATPIQFYLTDSTSQFFSGMLYFNSVPNYDSLKTSIDYVTKDLEHLINTFEWK